MNSLIQCKGTILPLLITSVLTCFALAPMVQAVGPDTDGDIPGFNNGEGIGVLVSRPMNGGFRNTGTGYQALNHLTFGNLNTATGFRALFSDINGNYNTATGAFSLTDNTNGNQNTATGYAALTNNTSGVNNTANGALALVGNSTGGSNTATGLKALSGNTTGSLNAAHGALALERNTTGAGNVANGAFALDRNTTGIANVAEGFDALFNNTTGNNNIGIGLSAGADLTTGSNNIDIGNRGVAGESSTVRIGTQGTQTATYVAGIFGATATNGLAVFVDMNGKLGTVTSSARFKDHIKPMDSASESIFALKPVAFRYKKHIDAKGTPQFGLVAEEVAKVNPDLVALDSEGKPYTVRYEQVNAMLLNEFLKEHRKNEEQQAIIERQQKQIEALTAGLQKVSAQLELSRSEPQTVAER